MAQSSKEIVKGKLIVKTEILKFDAGSVQKQIRVWVDPDEVKQIEFDTIKSSKTKKNLLILKGIYDINWTRILRYPVKNRFGYIVYGVMGRPGIPITYVRKETYNKQSGSTDLWFDKGYMLPAGKIIQAHEAWPNQILYWGNSIKEENVRKWFKLTYKEEVLISYQVSRYVYGNDELRTFPFRKRVALETTLEEHFLSIANKLPSKKLMELITVLQRIQFEKV